MLRTINILLVALMLIGAGVVYDFKYEAERAAAKLTRIARQIDAERDATATLKAEWSLLNQPKRLQDLAVKYRSYLELDPLDPTQIGTIDDIPFKPAVPGEGQPVPAKGSVRLAQPGKPIEKLGPIDRTGSIGKLMDRLPQQGKPTPPTTGAAKTAAPANPAAPMQLVPRSVVPVGGVQDRVTR
jgi:hypothetical protein